MEKLMCTSMLAPRLSDPTAKCTQEGFSGGYRLVYRLHLLQTGKHGYIPPALPGNNRQMPSPRSGNSVPQVVSWHGPVRQRKHGRKTQRPTGHDISRETGSDVITYP